MSKTKTAPTKDQVETLLEALEKEAGMTVKDRDTAAGIIALTMARQESVARMDEYEGATHVIVNGDVVSGFEFFGPFANEDEAFTFANNQFHLTKRWKVVELKKPLDR